MSRVEVTQPFAPLSDGILQTDLPLDGTPQIVKDQSGTSSTLLLATDETQVNSVLRVKTNNSELLDLEDNGSNNRFNINRDVQKINLDFSSKPADITTKVGAIRTAHDGVNLSDSISFLENGTIGINTDPDPSAQLHIASTIRGFLVPKMTNAERSAIVSPVAGLQIYNTTNNALAYYDGTSWGYSTGAQQTISGSGGTVNILFGSGNIINLTLTSSTTLTFTNHVVGTYILKITQSGSGSYSITWPASVKWSGGTAPTLSTTVGKIDIITLFHDGTNFFGTYSLNY